MTDPGAGEPSPSLPYGATEIHPLPSEYSDEFAIRLAESGASDALIDAAGGPGTAARLHGKGTPASRRAANAAPRAAKS